MVDMSLVLAKNYLHRAVVCLLPYRAGHRLEVDNLTIDTDKQTVTVTYRYAEVPVDLCEGWENCEGSQT